MKIPFFKNYWDKKDIKYVSQVIKRGMYWANGPEIAEFEKKIAAFVRRKYSLVFNSGTSALHAVLDALNIKSKEVIVPSFTFIATANTVLHAGGKPVFADIENETFGLDPEDVKRKITSKTCAIMPIHYGGCSCQIGGLKKIAKKNGLFLIEDAAESLGAKHQNKMVGTFGEAAMFSFTPTKIISTGEGGAIVTNSKKLYEKMKLFRSHGRLEKEDYFTSTASMDYISLGYNFRMPTICAAQGLTQLQKINRLISKRRKIAQYYNENLSNIKKIRTPLAPKGCYHIYQMYSILVREGRKTRGRLQEYLKKKGITSKIYFEPVHKTYFYKKVLGYNLKLETTEKLAGETLSLPIYPQLTLEEQNYVVKQIKRFFNKKGKIK